MTHRLFLVFAAVCVAFFGTMLVYVAASKGNGTPGDPIQQISSESPADTDPSVAWVQVFQGSAPDVLWKACDAGNLVYMSKSHSVAVVPASPECAK